MDGQEIEVKFYVRDLKKIEAGLLERKARLIQPRVLESNLRFDRPDGSLRAKGQALRLRQDTEARLTYKGPSAEVDGARSRVELEFTVGDFETARKFLEALGCVQFAVYEKYRAVYELDKCHIMLDELPYGEFVEIEGEDTAAIRKASADLGLNFEAAIGDSYLGIYKKFNLKRGAASDRLTFDSLRGLAFNPADLNIRAADE